MLTLLVFYLFGYAIMFKSALIAPLELLNGALRAMLNQSGQLAGGFKLQLLRLHG